MNSAVSTEVLRDKTGALDISATNQMITIEVIAGNMHACSRNEIFPAFSP